MDLGTVTIAGLKQIGEVIGEKEMLRGEIFDFLFRLPIDFGLMGCSVRQTVAKNIKFSSHLLSK